MSPDLVDEESLPQAIAKLLGISDTDAQQPDVASKIADIELSIDEAPPLAGSPATPANSRRPARL